MAPRWYTAVCWVFAALFAVCVALQYNDPDPIRWMAIYGAALVASAALPLVRAARWSRPLAYLTAAIAAVWGTVLLVRVWGVISPSDLVEKMSEKGGAVEEGRECGGLLIVAVWLAIAATVRGRWRVSARA